MVDEITDRTWVVLDAIDGRVHYAELGRLQPEAVPARGSLAALAGDGLTEKPSAVPRLEVLSPVDVTQLSTYEGPTWLDEAIVRNWRPEAGRAGFARQLDVAIAARGQWLVERQFVGVGDNGKIVPVRDMMASLRVLETRRLVNDLSREFKSIYVPNDQGSRISGVYERPIVTPTNTIAVIRQVDTFTLAPWKPTIEPMRGLAVTGRIGPNRVIWTRDLGRGLPGRN